MDRHTNINCICSLVGLFDKAIDEESRLRIRQVLYIHGIVEAVLTERIHLLPEASYVSK